MGAALPIAGTLLGGGGGLAGLGAFGTILEVGFGVLSALGQARAGDAEAAAARVESENQARQAELEAAAERTQSEIDAAERARRLKVTLSEQNAIFGASGALPTSGSFAAIGERTQQLGEGEIEQGLSASRIRQDLLKTQAQSFRASGEIKAQAAKSAGRTGLFGGLLSTATSVGGRGSVPTRSSSLRSLGSGIRRAG